MNLNFLCILALFTVINSSVSNKYILKHLPREASALNTILNDSELVRAMHTSDAVKAYVIGLLMSNIYKQAYAKLDDKEIIDIEMLNEELKEYLKELANDQGQVRKLVDHYQESGRMDMTTNDLQSVCSFVQKHYLKQPNAGNLFAAVMLKKSLAKEIYANISLATFYLKIPQFSYDLKRINEHDFYIYAKIYHNRLVASLLMIKELVPFIHQEIRHFLLDEDFGNGSFLFLSKYIKDDDAALVEQLAQKYIPKFLISDSLTYLYLSTRNCPLIVQHIENILSAEEFKYLHNWESELVKTHAYIPVSFNSLLINFHYTNTELYIDPQLQFVRIGDYLFTTPKTSYFSAKGAQEAFENGLLDFYAFLNDFDLFKRVQ